LKEDSEKNAQREADRVKEEEPKVSLCRLLKDITTYASCLSMQDFYPSDYLIDVFIFHRQGLKVAEEIKAAAVAALKVEEEQVCLNYCRNDLSSG
jgi:hypothetical protein